MIINAMSFTNFQDLINTTEELADNAGSLLTGKIIGAAIEVHKALGPGLLESAYEACLIYELRLRRLKVEHQKPLTDFL